MLRRSAAIVPLWRRFKNKMATEKLYEKDAYLREFDAKVLSCEKKDDNYLVVLDRSAFYPEGGGQPADRGILGDADVLDVHNSGDEVVHTCDAPLEPGTEVHGIIDWVVRFDHMQQHSGEHIVSGMICDTFHCSNVGFHMGEEFVTIDYDAPATWEELMEIEKRANWYIWENHAFESFYIDGDNPDGVEYRSKKKIEGKIRIARFPGADCCACCGTHVSSSAQVGLVKFVSVKNLRGGVRIELLAGKRAFDYLAKCTEQNSEVSALLSAKPFETAQAVKRVLGEAEEQKKKNASFMQEYVDMYAEKFTGAGDTAVLKPSMDQDMLVRMSEAVSSACGGKTAVFTGSGSSWSYAYRDMSDGFRDAVKEMNAALNGRGGGRGGFAQGRVAADETAIRNYLESRGYKVN